MQTIRRNNTAAKRDERTFLCLPTCLLLLFSATLARLLGRPLGTGEGALFSIFSSSGASSSDDCTTGEGTRGAVMTSGGPSSLLASPVSYPPKFVIAAGTVRAGMSVGRGGSGVAFAPLPAGVEGPPRLAGAPLPLPLPYVSVGLGGRSASTGRSIREGCKVGKEGGGGRACIEVGVGLAGALADSLDAKGYRLFRSAIHLSTASVVSSRILVPGTEMLCPKSTTPLLCKRAIKFSALLSRHLQLFLTQFDLPLPLKDEMSILTM